jgi:hypothetical protein
LNSAIFANLDACDVLRGGPPSSMGACAMPGVSEVFNVTNYWDKDSTKHRTQWEKKTAKKEKGDN